MPASTIALPNIKKMFIPDPGFFICDSDLAQADAQVVAWDANDKPLMDFFQAAHHDPDLDLHGQNASDIFGGPPTKDNPMRKRAKAGVHACLTADHEVLTPEGWVSVSATPQVIMAVCPVTAKALFETPKRWNVYTGIQHLYELEGNGYSQKVTQGHKLPVRTNTGAARNLKPVENLGSSDRLQYEAYHNGVGYHSVDFVRLLAAYEADGSKDQTRGIHWHLKKHRKLERLHTLLEHFGLAFTYTEHAKGTTSTRISLADSLQFRQVQFADKLQFSSEEKRSYIDELPYWDGHHAKTSVKLSNASEVYCEEVQTIAALMGMSGQVKKSQRCYELGLNSRKDGRLSSGTCQESEEYAEVYCPTTSTGAFLIRRNGKISVTGNCNYGVHAKTLSVALGISVKEAEAFIDLWFTAHPAIYDWQQRIRHDLQTTRTITNKFGNRKIFFGRTNTPSALAEALAWIPQSTVALVINRAWRNIEDLQNRNVEVLLQVHDSLVYQIKKLTFGRELKAIEQCFQVPIPYDIPLTIPAGLEYSDKSWGECRESDWRGRFV